MPTIELMVHPGYPSLREEAGGCGEGPDEFSMSSDRQHELDVMCSHSIKSFYKEAKLKLISSLFSCTS